MQESFWLWHCSGRYSNSLPLPSSPPPVPTEILRSSPVPLRRQLPASTSSETTPCQYLFGDNSLPVPLRRQLPASTSSETAPCQYLFGDNSLPVPLRRQLPASTSLKTSLTNQPTNHAVWPAPPRVFRIIRPCYRVTLRPCYRVTLRPCYSITLRPCYRVTLRPCYRVTLLLCYSVTLRPSYRVTLRPCYRVILRPCFRVTLRPSYRVTLRPCYRVTLRPCYNITLRLCHKLTLLFCYRVTLLPCYRVTALLRPCYRITLRPCYRVTLRGGWSQPCSPPTDALGGRCWGRWVAAAAGSPGPGNAGTPDARSVCPPRGWRHSACRPPAAPGDRPACRSRRRTAGKAGWVGSRRRWGFPPAAGTRAPCVGNLEPGLLPRQQRKLRWRPRRMLGAGHTWTWIGSLETFWEGFRSSRWSRWRKRCPASCSSVSGGSLTWRTWKSSRVAARYTSPRHCLCAWS